MSDVDVDVDVLVVGAGVAGLTTALALGGARSVLVVAAGGGSTPWAQGGIAAAFAADDDPSRHAADTRGAGAGLCDPAAVRLVTAAAPAAVAGLLAAGARFDADAAGRLLRTREGGHRRRRIVHAGGDATGAEVARALRARARQAGLPWRDADVVGLTLGDGRHGRQVTGALVGTADGRVEQITARAVVLATGGLAGAYPASTNPGGVDGRGIALALLAGAAARDLEFVQFHPTALAVGARLGQLPLVSEAVRGEGAVLRDATGRAFMAGRHPLGDLAPRDVVAREIDATMRADGTDSVWLDATGIEGFAARFPTVTAACAATGVDPATTPIPVAPAAHYTCGGVGVDSWGATTVPGLYAVGEAAATGLHGANRLASNSLLEGLVYGSRVATGLILDLPEPVAGDAAVRLADDRADAAGRARAGSLLGEHAGVRRGGEGLRTAAAELATAGDGPVAIVARALVAAALARTESRGCHWRADHPQAEAGWLRRLTVRLDADGRPVVEAPGLRQAA